jgi:beta-glucuronidase
VCFFHITIGHLKFVSILQWINGELVVKHEFGHLPFEADITDVLKYGQENRVTVLCDNVLIQTTIPQGKILEMAK